jgi:quercetin dioxygenase-like cupin family protein
MEFGHIDTTQGELPEALRRHFQGEARIQRLASPFADGPGVFAVHFEAGGRTRPHLHRSGQLLHVAAGEGIVANESERRVVRTGDVITVLPDEWHWHGATPTSPMTHLTVQMPGSEETDWEVDERDWAADYA